MTKVKTAVAVINEDEDEDEKDNEKKSGNEIVDIGDVPTRKQKKLTDHEQVDLGMKLVMSSCLIFKNQLGIAHVGYPWKKIGVDGVLYDYATLDDQKFLSWVSREIAARTGVRLTPGARREFSVAVYDEANRPDIPVNTTYVRMAPISKYEACIDLGDADTTVIRITANGYEVCPSEDAPFFLRTPGTAALPNPMGVEPNLLALFKYVNLSKKGDRYLLIVIILFALGSKGPYPIAIITGSAGSAKSTLSRALRRSIDPRSPEIQSMPKNEHDLVITANSSGLVILDNIHKVPQSMSDAFCRLALGGGLSVRKLYSDNAMMSFDVKRPIVLNGIQDFADQPDLLDRSIHLDLPLLKVENRRTEDELWAAFEADHPAIFAGLLDALSKTYKVLPEIDLESPVRMADFYMFGNAVEVALDWPEDAFHDAYLDNQSNMIKETNADDPLFQAIIDFVKDEVQQGKGASGTSSLWLDKLEGYADEKIRKNPKLWPHSPHALGKRLRAKMPDLSKVGIDVMFTQSGERIIKIVNNMHERGSS